MASNRRLATIMFTDMVGYSALVARDERLAYRLLERHKKVVRGVLPKFSGREVEIIGDAFLVEFHSALLAMQCAIAIHQRLAGLKPEQADDPAIQLRIALHLGDIEKPGRNRVYGDTINVAARLQELAPKGGIALSAPVHHQIETRVVLPYQSIGKPTLKNISQSLEVFTVEAAAIALLPSQLNPTDITGQARPPHLGLVAVALLLALCAGLYAFLGFAPHKAAQPPVSPPTLAEQRSIAVLPFENLSEDPKNAYFVDGMQDEILTALAKIHALKVISRTSTEQYRGKEPDLPAIAKALNVATVLKGSVQRAGNRVRINVQLIDVRTDAHLWAETYDRDLNDLFKVQSEVTREITTALQASLLPAEAKALASPPTRIPKAYDLYLQAISIVQRTDASSGPVSTAITLYEQALAVDPNFALASAALAQAHMDMYWGAPDRTPARLAAAKSAAERALALQPDLGEGHLALGHYHYWGHRDYAAALEQVELARRTLPNDARVPRLLGLIARRQGRWDTALQAFTDAAVLDPQGGRWFIVVETNWMMRRYAEADAANTRVMAAAHNPAQETVARGQLQVWWKGELAPLRTALGTLAPGSDDYKANLLTFYFLHLWSRDYVAALDALAANQDLWLHYKGSNIFLPKPLYAARTYQAKGDSGKARLSYAEAQRLLEKELKERPDDADLHAGLGLSYAGLGRREDAIREGARAVELLPVSKDAVSGPDYLKCLAEIYVQAGERDQALELLRKLLAMPAGEALSPALLELDPVWDPLRDDARFKALLAEPGKT